MEDFKDDEIQVLGVSKSHKKDIAYNNPRKDNKGKIFRIVIIAAVIIAATAVSLYIYWGNITEGSDTSRDDYKNTGKVENPDRQIQEISNNANSPRPISEKIQNSEIIKKEFIQNNIPMNVYLLVNLKAELTLETPDPKDESIYLAFFAADVRGDNSNIIGDFVINGQQLSHGKQREGFCSIIKGDVSIGNSKNDDILRFCVENDGNFFRQYNLVHNGVKQPMKDVKREKRRALAMQGKELYFIETKYKESLRDFGEALSSIGLSEAINLPGGDHPLLIYKEKGENKFYGDGFDIDNLNYMIFRGKN